MKNILSTLKGIDEVIPSAGRVLIATDFDGTLCPIAESPSRVRVDPGMLHVLRGLIQSERLTLAVISGRTIADLRSRLPLSIAVAGNHGLEIESDDIQFVHPWARALRPRLVEVCHALAAAVSRWPGAVIENKELSATLHYRSVDIRSHRALLVAARRCVSPFLRQFALRAGKMALEIRPKVQWDKGSALAYIQEQLGPFDLTICIGDDRTDEALFVANAGQPNIYVGDRRTTAATYHAANPGEVAIFLSHVADVIGTREPGRTAVTLMA